jgi:hypothetical protein
MKSPVLIPSEPEGLQVLVRVFPKAFRSTINRRRHPGDNLILKMALD